MDYLDAILFHPNSNAGENYWKTNRQHFQIGGESESICNFFESCSTKICNTFLHLMASLM